MLRCRPTPSSPPGSHLGCCASWLHTLHRPGATNCFHLLVLLLARKSLEWLGTLLRVRGSGGGGLLLLLLLLLLAMLVRATLLRLAVMPTWLALVLRRGDAFFASAPASAPGATADSRGGRWGMLVQGCSSWRCRGGS